MRGAIAISGGGFNLSGGHVEIEQATVQANGGAGLGIQSGALPGFSFKLGQGSWLKRSNRFHAVGQRNALAPKASVGTSFGGALQSHACGSNQRLRNLKTSSAESVFWLSPHHCSSILLGHPAHVHIAHCCRHLPTPNKMSLFVILLVASETARSNSSPLGLGLTVPYTLSPNP